MERNVHTCMFEIHKWKCEVKFRGKFRTSFGEFRDKSRNGRGVKISPSKAGKCECLSFECG